MAVASNTSSPQEAPRYGVGFFILVMIKRLYIALLTVFVLSVIAFCVGVTGFIINITINVFLKIAILSLFYAVLAFFFIKRLPESQ